MGQLTYETAEVQALLESIGAKSGLLTTAKSTLVAAINELFTSASNGKQAIAAALTGKGVSAAASDTFAELAETIGQLPARMVANDDSITPTGTYATSTYYNTTYGVLVGYCPDGSVLISMKGGTSTSYENLNFSLASAPDGVTIETSSTAWDTSDPAGNLYVCRLKGIVGKVNIAIAMSAVNATYDYVTCAITVTEVTA